MKKRCVCSPNTFCGVCCERKLFYVDSEPNSEPMLTPKGDLKLVSHQVIEGYKAHLQREQGSTELLFPFPKKNKPHFRINRLRINSVAVDSEDSPGMRKAAERAGHEYDEEAWQDLVVTLEDQDGNKFEAARITARRDGLHGSCTYVAKLVCARSWGAETDDDSISCPLCFHRGHGAGACKDRR